MRQETIVKTYLEFSELNKEQKSKVLDDLRDLNTDYEWHENALEEAENFLNLLGFSNVKIEFSGFSRQGDGASFTGVFDVPSTKAELKKRAARVKAEAPKYALFNYSLMSFDRDEKEQKQIEVFRLGRVYSHSGTIASENKDLQDFARAFSDQLYKDLSNEFDYLQSDEAIIDTIEANNYEFDAENLKLA